jgi:hypothetical protein
MYCLRYTIMTTAYCRDGLVERDSFVLVLLVVLPLLLFGNIFIRDEFKRNDRHEPPSDQQSKWHLQHIREDLHALVLLAYLLLAVIAYAVFLK